MPPGTNIALAGATSGFALVQQWLARQCASVAFARVRVEGPKLWTRASVVSQLGSRGRVQGKMDPDQSTDALAFSDALE